MRTVLFVVILLALILVPAVAYASVKPTDSDDQTSADRPIWGNRTRTPQAEVTRAPREDIQRGPRGEATPRPTLKGPSAGNLPDRPWDRDRDWDRDGDRDRDRDHHPHPEPTATNTPQPSGGGCGTMQISVAAVGVGGGIDYGLTFNTGTAWANGEGTWILTTCQSMNQGGYWVGLKTNQGNPTPYYAQCNVSGNNGGWNGGWGNWQPYWNGSQWYYPQQNWNNWNWNGNWSSTFTRLPGEDISVFIPTSSGGARIVCNMSNTPFAGQAGVASAPPVVQAPPPYDPYAYGTRIGDIVEIWRRSGHGDDILVKVETWWENQNLPLPSADVISRAWANYEMLTRR